MADNFGLRIGVEGERDFKNSLKEINRAFKLLGSEMRLATSQFDENERSVQSLTARNEVLNKSIDEQKRKISTLENALSNAANSFGENDRRTLAWRTQLNNANAELNEMERELNDSNDEIQKLNRQKLDKVTGNFKKAGDTINNNLLAGLYAATVAFKAVGRAASEAGRWVLDSISVYTEFEDSMKKVQATIGVSGIEGEKAFNQLSQAAKEAGSTTRFTASQSAEALNYLALAGYDTQKSIESLPGVLTLAAASGMELADASDMVTDSMAALGLQTSEMDAYMDLMARTSQRSNTSVQQLGEGILVAGATMKNAGQELDTINVMLGILANRGLKGAEGGTKLRNIMLSLTSPTAAANKELKNLGVGITDSSGNIRELGDILTDLNGKLKGLSEEEKVKALSNIFNKRDIAGANALLSGTSEEMEKLYEELSKADGAAQEMADTMEGGLGGSIRSLKSAYEGLQIAIGEQFASVGKEAIGGATELVRDITKILNDGIQEGDISEIGAKLSEFLVNGMKKIGEYLPALINIIFTMLSEVINMLVSILPTLIPRILDGVILLIQGLITAISENTEPLAEMAVYLVTTIINFILDALPMLIVAAVDLVVALALGISEALPELIPSIIAAVVLIVETLINNLGKIIDAAFELVVGLAEGILNALPVLLEALPSLINTIVDFMVENGPKISLLGVNLIIKLAEGIIKTIPELVKQLPKIVAALVKGIGKILSHSFDIGKNIVRGIWNGIASMISWLRDKISGFLSGIVSSVKGVLGISSPSKVFEEIGDNMASGLAGGFNAAMNKVAGDIEGAIPTNFNIKQDVNTSGNNSGLLTTGPLIRIDTMIVRTEDDIRRVSQGLYNLIQSDSRAQGRLNLT